MNLTELIVKVGIKALEPADLRVFCVFCGMHKYRNNHSGSAIV